ncbi:DrmB family protein [Streptomyces sp. NPDC088115]|uniref:DrmB family protein n=1 Tax=Streptomyces sp. NPDC088115 TaxID=3365824 RepID=UPI0038121EEC
MGPVPPRTRRRGLPAKAARSARKLGEIRRAQLITTYGVGAMIAVENESFLIRGLDSWDISEAPFISEPRLAWQLGVSGFRMPPAPDADSARDGVRAVRFPEMYSCPHCHQLQPFRRFNSPPGRAECSSCQESLVPSRFVIACTHGHLDDFPYWKWVHRGNRTGTGSCGGQLTFEADGSTASLRAVLIGCSCGVEKVSMEGAFRRQALRDLGIRCGGRRPWLKDVPVDACQEPPRTLQRGSSSVWFPVMHSALSIPPWSQGIAKLVAPLYADLKEEDAASIKAYVRIRKLLLHHPKYTDEDVVAEVERRREAETSAVRRGDDAEAANRAGDYRRKLYESEYRSLSKPHPEDSEEEQEFVCEPPAAPVDILRSSYGLTQVMLVKRLREVRVLQSFRRVEEPSPADSDRRQAAISPEKPSWLPAFEVSGEGVFIRLDPERLRNWEAQPEQIARATLIRENHERLLSAHAGDSDKPVPPSPATPRFLLLHALAHILINEWSLDGGYPAASLRERLYSDEDMAGVLIYTATSDSAGSLGGVVAQGEPDRLAVSLRAALHRAGWCSNDPLCMESQASGADSLNMAACHACLLLPETSCENNNILLDRAALIGTPEDPSTGFFSQALHD